ncbi:geminin, DNA replication inhibitor L homeolog isoform X2 [Xenopus laevis]|uniref:Geminin, DNA replication inhibitor L homeolog isoform X2 n=1 Tax=Xenopus laevis TaxID=8355 RepID=A0A8J1KYA3_XENLA|nr:geminin, DNA replication inhibitor L homeolog isoform X2 [Xenopus laevis]
MLVQQGYLYHEERLKMNSNMKQRSDVENPSMSIKNYIVDKTNEALAPRRTLKVIQQSASGCLVGRAKEPAKNSTKRKLWNDQLTSKKAKVEVAVDPENKDCPSEAYDLMVKETPTCLYWKDVAEERRKALYEALQENEKLHQEIELKDEEIARLKQENDELMELAGHVQYMANMIERLTGNAPQSLEDLKNLDLEEARFEDEAESRIEDETDMTQPSSSDQNMDKQTV